MGVENLPAVDDERGEGGGEKRECTISAVVRWLEMMWLSLLLLLHAGLGKKQCGSAAYIKVVCIFEGFV